MGFSLRKITLYPFLFALYPVLYLLAVNIDQISPLMAFRAMALPLAGCLLLFLLMALVTRNWQKAALVAAFWMVAIYLLFFFLYVPLYRAVEKTVLFGINIGRHRTLLVAILVLLVAGTVLLATRKGTFGTTTAVLNLVAIAAIAFPLFQIAAYKVQANRLFSPGQTVDQQEIAVSLPQDQTPPDVYYIVLDMYTRQDLLQEFFNYDNAPFLQFLTDRGFYVADCSQSNYTSTQYSLGSSLNMEYLQEMGLAVDDPDLVQAVQQSTVWSLFKKLGYRTVAFETGFSITEFRHADEYLSPFGSLWDGLFYGGVNSFEAMILKNSAGTLLYEAKPNMAKKYQTILDTPYIQYRERIDYSLDRLETIAGLEGPKFVFAHILAPHDPFVFDRNGNFVFRETPFTLNSDKEYVTRESYIAGYTGELEYLNSRIEQIVSAILDGSKQPPIIILQGDHGSPRSNDTGGYAAILNAYYFPENGTESLYPTISPVNSFRAVFNQFFGGQFPILGDQSYKVDTDAQTYLEYEGYLCSSARP